MGGGEYTLCDGVLCITRIWGRGDKGGRLAHAIAWLQRLRWEGLGRSGQGMVSTVRYELILLKLPTMCTFDEFPGVLCCRSPNRPDGGRRGKRGIPCCVTDGRSRRECQAPAGTYGTGRSAFAVGWQEQRRCEKIKSPKPVPIPNRGVFCHRAR